MPEPSAAPNPLHFDRLKLTQFRNYETLELELHPRLNCFVGLNGAGKTNLLEAVHFLALTKGFFADKDAVRYGEKFFMIEARLPNQQRLECNFMSGRAKKILIDGQPVEKISQHIGFVPIVAVLPNDIDLIREGNTLRRRWLDSLLSQSDPDYLQAAIRYARALEQRNALLQQAAALNQTPPADALEIWDQQLAFNGVTLAAKRSVFIQEFQPFFEKFFFQIIENQEIPSLLFKTQFENKTLADWLSILAANRRRDLAAARTTAGVHRDELHFLINEKPIRQFGSQGQQKTYLTALKLAQYHFLQEKTGKNPLLLLDDLFDKLDADRVAHIARLLFENAPGQIWITDVSAERLRQALHSAFGAELAFFQVKDRKISRL